MNSIGMKDVIIYCVSIFSLKEDIASMENYTILSRIIRDLVLMRFQQLI